MRHTLLALCLALCSTQLLAATTTLDFEELSPPGSSPYRDTIESQGFLFEGLGTINGFFCIELFAPGCYFESPYIQDSGDSNQLGITGYSGAGRETQFEDAGGDFGYVYNANFYLNISRLDEARFSLLSMDLDFTGFGYNICGYAGGTQIECIYDDTVGLGSSAWENLDSVRITSRDYAGFYDSFDNEVDYDSQTALIDNIVVSTIPIPAPLLLLGSALIALRTFRPKTK